MLVFGREIRLGYLAIEILASVVMVHAGLRVLQGHDVVFQLLDACLQAFGYTPFAHAEPSEFLTYIEFPNSLLKIEDFAFAHCVELSRIDSQRLEDHEGENGDGPVQGNHNHQMLQYIGYRAFHDCPIETFNFNKHLTHLGEGAFEGCHFTEVNLSKCVELKVIPAYCFHEGQGYNLDAIILPAFVEEIGDCAFTGSSAQTVFLGISLKKIGHEAISLSDADIIVLPTTLEEIYSDSIEFGNNSYTLAFAGAKRRAEWH